MFALGGPVALGPAATISDPDELKKLKKTDKKRRQKMARNGGGGGGGFMDLGRSLLNFLVGGNGGGGQAGTGMTTK